MTKLNDYALKEVEAFLEAIKPWGAAYKEAVFGFIGIPKGEVIEILHGHLVLPNSSFHVSTRKIETASIIGHLFRLEDIHENYESFLRKLTSDSLDTPLGKIRLMTNENNSNTQAYFSPYESGLEIAQPRINKLTIRGDSFKQDITHEATLELRSSPTPYDSIEELASELLINYQRDSAIIQVTANNIAQVDFSRKVDGENANVGVHLAPFLETSHCSIGIKVVQRGQVIARERLEGDALSWEERQGYRAGMCNFRIPRGAAVQCFVSYMGNVQHHGWITDPSTSPNFFRVLHNGFDAELKGIKTLLFDETRLKGASRDFEAGVTNLLFMMGFTVNPLVGKPLEDNPDIIATTKNGNVAIFECTTNQINKDGKIGKLVERAEIARTHLSRAAFDPKVIPIIVTAKPRNSIAEIEQANKSGILVLTKEDIEQMLDNTFVYQDPDTLFATWWAKLHRPQFGGHLNR